MIDEDAFLDAIRANLQDDATLLIYADWLQENAGNGVVTCPTCRGTKKADPDKVGIYAGGLISLSSKTDSLRQLVSRMKCHRCDGEGVVEHPREALGKRIRQLIRYWPDHTAYRDHCVEHLLSTYLAIR